MKIEELNNPTLKTDSYKISHWLMLLNNTRNVFSYGCSRKGAKYPVTVFHGLQPIALKHLCGPVVTREHIERGEEFTAKHLGSAKAFNRPMWEGILNKHGGYLPIKIRAVPEGAAIPVGHPLVNVEVMDTSIPHIAGLTNHWEPILTHTWLPSNVATIGHIIKQHLIKAFQKGADTMDLLPFMLHDFGFRSVGTLEDAGIAGGAHLINFKGTDTIQGILHAQYYYNTDEMLGFSVAASEHSIKTQLGRAGEQQITENLLDIFPEGILSDVQDSYSVVDSIEYIGTNLKKKILNRNGKYVFRPDSPRFPGDTASAQILYIANRLEHYFGATINSKGYKVLNPKVGIIYGDGLSVEDILDSIDTLMANGYSPETCVYGMGGGLLQKHTRDTQRNAFKSSAQQRDDIWYDVQKDPADKTKASEPGKVETFTDGKNFITARQGENIPGYETYMEDVVVMGELVRNYKFQDLRNIADKSLGL